MCIVLMLWLHFGLILHFCNQYEHKSLSQIYYQYNIQFTDPPDLTKQSTLVCWCRPGYQQLCYCQLPVREMWSLCCFELMLRGWKNYWWSQRWWYYRCWWRWSSPPACPAWQSAPPAAAPGSPPRRWSPTGTPWSSGALTWEGNLYKFDSKHYLLPCSIEFLQNTWIVGRIITTCDIPRYSDKGTRIIGLQGSQGVHNLLQLGLGVADHVGVPRQALRHLV